MGLRINTNVAALQAQRNLGKTSKTLNKALERLASGKRIVRAGDDAAGLAISEGLKSQVRGLRQAVRNANDASGFLSTAEGALAEMTNIAQRLRELAVQAANGSIGPTDRGFLDAERAELVDEFNRIATSTSFNTTKLLDGTFETVELQVGVQKGEKISFTIGDARATSLGALARKSGPQNAIQYDPNAFTGLTVNGESITVNATDDGVSYDASSDGTGPLNTQLYSAIAIARGVNRVSGTTGVFADVQENVVSMENMDFSSFKGNFAEGDLVINGVNIIGTANTVNDFIARVNEFSNSTGVKARLKSGSNDGLDVELFASDGRSVKIDMAAISGSYSGIIFTGGALSGSAGYSNTAEFVGVLRNSENFGTITQGRFFVNGTHSNGAALTDVSNNRAGTISNEISQGFQRIYTGQIQLRSSEAILIGNTNDNTSLIYGFSDNVVAVDNDSALFNVDISDKDGAQDALATVDATLQQLTELRSNLGSIQNRLEAVVNNLSVTNENLSAAAAEIGDADLAVEVAELTKAQILQQAGVSVLGQANASSQVALSLLQF